MPTKLKVIIPGADMRCRLHGLWDHAKKTQGIEPKHCISGDMLVFLNNAKDMVAVIAIKTTGSRGVLLYDESEHGRIEVQAIKHIPETFGGVAFDMTKATAKALAELLPAKRSRKVAEA